MGENSYDRSYKEIFRVLRPSGKTVGLVDPQDHRRFSSFKGYHPLKFLEYSREKWYEIAKHINFHNQITTPEHKAMIMGQGFSMDSWETLMSINVSNEMHQKFHPFFRSFDPKVLGVLRFAFTASKPQPIDLSN